jgi:hypothetical protein
MEKTIEELKQEADSLGITYQKNIGAEKLQAKIDEHDDKLQAELDGETEQSAEVSETPKTSGTKGTLSRAEAIKKIKEQERANLETKVVKISMVDKREVSTATTVYFSNGAVGMRIPLDMWVEVPIALIRLVDDAKAVDHVEAGGQTTHRLTKKYVIEYRQ